MGFFHEEVLCPGEGCTRLERGHNEGEDRVQHSPLGRHPPWVQLFTGTYDLIIEWFEAPPPLEPFLNQSAT